MRIQFIAIMVLVYSLVPLSAEPGLTLEASIEGGAAVTKEPGYASASGTAFEGRLGIATGDAWGFVARAGLAYQAPSAFTSAWFRYRGFMGLSLGAGLRHTFGPLDATLVAGSMLARYDHSYSYFWFPYIESGISMPVINITPRLALKAGASIPIYLRADAFTIGLRAVLTLSLMPTRRADTRTRK